MGQKALAPLIMYVSKTWSKDACTPPMCEFQPRQFCIEAAQNGLLRVRDFSGKKVYELNLCCCLFDFRMLRFLTGEILSPGNLRFVVENLLEYHEIFMHLNDEGQLTYLFRSSLPEIEQDKFKRACSWLAEKSDYHSIFEKQVFNDHGTLILNYKSQNENYDRDVYILLNKDKSVLYDAVLRLINLNLIRVTRRMVRRMANVKTQNVHVILASVDQNAHAMIARAKRQNALETSLKI